MYKIAVFPGYYTGRAVHIHAKVFPEWEVLPNGTFTGGRLVHTGQFFFDDEVNMQIDKVMHAHFLAC
jgi:protocatechuate 3,4-dioxygenase beta subunit